MLAQPKSSAAFCQLTLELFCRTVSLESGDCERRGGKKYGDGIRVEVDGQDTVLVVVVERGDRGFVVVRHCDVVLWDVGRDGMCLDWMLECLENLCECVCGSGS